MNILPLTQRHPPRVSILLLNSDIPPSIAFSLHLSHSHLSHSSLFSPLYNCSSPLSFIHFPLLSPFPSFLLAIPFFPLSTFSVTAAHVTPSLFPSSPSFPSSLLLHPTLCNSVSSTLPLSGPPSLPHTTPRVHMCSSPLQGQALRPCEPDCQKYIKNVVDLIFVLILFFVGVSDLILSWN